MTDETIWVLKVFFKIFVLAFVAVMVFRIWYWMDNCVISRIYSRIYVNPPVYQCAVRPFNFTDNYIKMLEHNRAMSDRMKAGVKVEDFEKLEYRSVTEDWTQPR